jgi:hypothetical protein
VSAVFILRTLFLYFVGRDVIKNVISNNFSKAVFLVKTGQSSRRSRESSRPAKSRPKAGPKAGTPAADPQGTSSGTPYG